MAWLEDGRGERKEIEGRLLEIVKSMFGNVGWKTLT